MASLRKNNLKSFFVVSAILFVIFGCFDLSHAWDHENCPNFCRCFWLYGLRWADCTGHRLYSVQIGIDDAVQALDLSNNSISSLANYELRVNLFFPPFAFSAEQSNRIVIFSSFSSFATSTRSRAISRLILELPIDRNRKQRFRSGRNLTGIQDFCLFTFGVSFSSIFVLIYGQFLLFQGRWAHETEIPESFGKRHQRDRLNGFRRFGTTESLGLVEKSSLLHTSGYFREKRKARGPRARWQ